ncbi:hypothetical protein CEXT_783361 [Caerostris extrusa]|uniref:Uncharacterized protein n=1 Tax=Caerostris extrusa TaxID=172846 RepID=A0AAV4MSM6_CAEEX|nr:hypothetical protein CEXT_783361 [Caerostris extrusa]
MVTWKLKKGKKLFFLSRSSTFKIEFDSLLSSAKARTSLFVNSRLSSHNEDEIQALLLKRVLFTRESTSLGTLSHITSNGRERSPSISFKK